ncbi:MAG: long-chain fatty acid--CoA ligase [Chloroflexi bacterium]|nr:MAG: long-chain fatty acid--CoA ligase [Chloroflexota bacterium]
MDDSAFQAANARAAYLARPWLKHYSSFVPPELATNFSNGLEMFLATVRAMADQAATYYFDETITYGELDRKSTALAAALKERGVAYGDRVALYLQNIPQFLIAMYAIWKVGAIAVLCNPMFKQKELEYHLNDSGAKGLICLESLYETVARYVVGSTKVEFVITTSELDYAGKGELPALLASSKKQRFAETLDLLELLSKFDGATVEFASLAPTDIAFLTYTSGTTGLPKGAMNTHANVVFNATVYKEWMQLGEDDIVIGMKKIYSGGAPVSPAIVENFQEITGAYIHNIYGLTETTSPSHATPLGGRAPVDPDSGALAVGVPIPNTICRVVDVTTGEDLPVGEVGELITKGPEVVAGYWQKPEETANAIRDGYLYTGDVAKMDEEGWFYIVDRKKDMIIVSGYKVWPRDVEDTLYQHPAVREAAVIGVADAYRGETVKAYVALKSGYEGKVKPEELIEFCKERMANYKYPRHIEFLDEVPKTVTGKFLRRELRDKARQ